MATLVEWFPADGSAPARFTTGSRGSCRLFYTMSTWNPYGVVVMQTDLELAAAHKGKTTAGATKS